MQHINRDYKFLIGQGTAEIIKSTIGNAFPGNEVESMEVKGRDLRSGVPQSLTITSEDIRKMISEEVKTIVQTVRSGLEQMPPELSADILDDGIVLTGGGSLLKNMDILLREETKVPVAIAEKPLFTVALGAGKALADASFLKEAVVE